MDIGKKIKELRLSNDLTLEELASRSELTKGFLSQVERNLTSPSISTLEDILEALGTDLSHFSSRKNSRRSYFILLIFLKTSVMSIRSNGSFLMHRKMTWSRSC